MYRALTTIACVVLLSGTSPNRETTPANAPAANEPLWSSCQDALDSLRDASSSASDAAKDVKSKRDDFDECQRYPETYDLRGDGCRSLHSDYESAVGDYESKMDDVDSRLEDVQSSCAHAFTINRMSPLEASQRRLDGARQRLCTSYRNFLPSLGAQAVLQMCKAQAGAEEGWCKSCLGIP